MDGGEPDGVDGSRGGGAYEPAVEVTRSGEVESVHYASAALVDRKGRLQGFLGDPHMPVVLRSAMKFMQALPFFQEGLHDKYGLTPAEQAITMGSHSGQSFHVEAVLSILAKADIPAGTLDCGRHRPYHRGTARELPG